MELRAWDEVALYYRPVIPALIKGKLVGVVIDASPAYLRQIDVRDRRWVIPNLPAIGITISDQLMKELARGNSVAASNGDIVIPAPFTKDGKRTYTPTKEEPDGRALRAFVLKHACALAQEIIRSQGVSYVAPQPSPHTVAQLACDVAANIYEETLAAVQQVTNKRAENKKAIDTK